MVKMKLGGIVVAKRKRQPHLVRQVKTGRPKAAGPWDMAAEAAERARESDE
jgi:hypothetical protein